MLKRKIAIAVIYFIAILVVCAIAKVFFMLFNPAAYSEVGFSTYFKVIGAGMSMDRTVAGYLTAPLVLFLIIASFMANVKVVNRVINAWYLITAALLSITFIADTVLYSYWGFKLDTTPLFYLTTSPAAAAASATWWQIIGGIILFVLLTYGLYSFFHWVTPRVVPEIYPPSTKTELKRAGALTFLLLLLFIPIRGGFTVATMNPSAAYFSDDAKLNHAAVNPFFNFLYTASHSDDFGSQFGFYEDEKAERIFREATTFETAEIADSLKVRLRVKHPDVYLIILESFSNHLFPSLGGESVAVRLDSVANAPGSLLFTNIYASSFRTDRAIVSILSGFPAQPTTSISKYVEKTSSLPSLAKSLDDAGYETIYYYGGDARFANKRAYLLSTGFNKVYTVDDFPGAEQNSKWGVHDRYLFEKALGDGESYNPDAPKLRVIQTLSSHEPFEVPFEPLSANEPKEVTAFRYTDNYAAEFINKLHSNPEKWNNALIVIVPDHYGCYPKNLGDEDAHRIPIIFTGGALESPIARFEQTGGQTDLAATVLGLLDLPADKFEYSRDLLSTKPGNTVFSSRNTFALACDSNLVIYNINSDKIEEARGDTAGMEPKLKAYLQRIYRDISKR